MATNNAINLKSSGIVSYDGAGTFSALANPLTVSNGGTGIATNTAYSVICAGTTSTGALQNVSGVGTAGQVLTSSGAGALPTWSNPGGYVFFISWNNFSPADATTYFFGTFNLDTTTLLADASFIVPKNGTLISAYGTAGCAAAVGNENSSFYIRINNTTDVTITTTYKFNATDQDFSNSSLNTSVSAGDYLSFKWVTPTWATNPTSVSISCTIFLI